MKGSRRQKAGQPQKNDGETNSGNNFQAYDEGQEDQEELAELAKGNMIFLTNLLTGCAGMTGLIDEVVQLLSTLRAVTHRGADGE